MIELREITDVEEWMNWRREVLTVVFSILPDKQLLEANFNYFMRNASNGNHIAVKANTTDGAEVGCGAICFQEEMPSPDNHTGRCAYLMNIYVRESFRRIGVATTIIKYLIDKAKSRDCQKIYLEATSTAKNLYRSIGFVELSDYMLYEKT